MAQIHEFLSMGGYAGFVWPAYAVALIVIGGLGVQSVRSLRVLRREVEAMEEDRPRRSRRPRARPDPGTGDAALSGGAWPSWSAAW